MMKGEETHMKDGAGLHWAPQSGKDSTVFQVNQKAKGWNYVHSFKLNKCENKQNHTPEEVGWGPKSKILSSNNVEFIGVI